MDAIQDALVWLNTEWMKIARAIESLRALETAGLVPDETAGGARQHFGSVGAYELHCGTVTPGLVSAPVPPPAVAERQPGADRARTKPATMASAFHNNPRVRVESVLAAAGTPMRTAEIVGLTKLTAYKVKTTLRHLAAEKRAVLTGATSTARWSLVRPPTPKSEPEVEVVWNGTKDARREVSLVGERASKARAT